MNSKFEARSFSNSRDMDIWKSKMDAIYKTDKPNLQSLAWWEYSWQDDDLFTSNTTICSQAMILFTVVKYIFNSFFGHQGEAVVPLTNDHIMSARSIWSFRHLEHQDPSIISDSIGRARMEQQFQRRSWRSRNRVQLS